MIEQPKWIPDKEPACIRQWTDYLHAEAKRLFIQDGTHGNMMFSFNKESGLISVNLIPPNINDDQLDDALISAVNEHHLYGIVLIAETWVYFIKENDHTAFQLLDGEMRVSDLNDEDKKEALIIRMENCHGDCLIYLDEIVRDENGHSLKESKLTENAPKKWFIEQSYKS